MLELLPNHYSTSELGHQRRSSCTMNQLFNHHRGHNSQGSGFRSLRPHQASLVEDFVLKKIDEGFKDHPDWEGELNQCKKVFMEFQTPDEKEVETVAKLFEVHLMVAYQQNTPVYMVGDPHWPRLCVSNDGVTDGAGNTVPHFRYVWSVEPEAKNAKQPQDLLKEAMA